MEAILWKISTDNLMENNTLDQIDGSYTLENWYGQFYGKGGGGLDWANSWSLRMSGEQRDTYGTTMARERESYGTTMARERESYCNEAKQIRLAARNTNLWNNPLVRHVRTNEVSEHMSPSERRELLLQVRTKEVSEHMLQKRPKGALSDRRECQANGVANEVSDKGIAKRLKGAPSD